MKILLILTALLALTSCGESKTSGPNKKSDNQALSIDISDLDGKDPFSVAIELNKLKKQHKVSLEQLDKQYFLDCRTLCHIEKRNQNE